MSLRARALLGCVLRVKPSQESLCAAGTACCSCRGFPCLRSHLGAAVPPRGCSLLGVPKEGQQLNGSAAAHAEIKGEILPSGFFAFSHPFANPPELSSLSGGFCRAVAFLQDAAPEHQPRPRTCTAAGDSQSRQLPGKPSLRGLRPV